MEEIRKTLSAENTQISGEIEELRGAILDQKLELDKEEEESKEELVAGTFLRALLKKLETCYLTRKKPVTVTVATTITRTASAKRPLKLRTIAKEAVTCATGVLAQQLESSGSKLLTHHSSRPQSKGCSKVRMLRTAVASFREGGSPKEDNA